MDYTAIGYERESILENHRVHICILICATAMMISSIIFAAMMVHSMHDLNDKMTIMVQNTYLMCNTTSSINPFLPGKCVNK